MPTATPSIKPTVCAPRGPLPFEPLAVKGHSSFSHIITSLCALPTGCCARALCRRKCQDFRRIVARSTKRRCGKNTGRKHWSPKVIKDIRAAAHKLHFADDKIPILLEAPRCGNSIAAICRRKLHEAQPSNPSCGSDRIKTLAYKYILWFFLRRRMPKVPGKFLVERIEL